MNVCTVSTPANLQPDHDVQGTTVNWVGGESCLVCCVCDNYQQAINTRDALRFLLQPMQYSPVCGHMGSQCFDEGDRGNWADRWYHRTRVGTRVGHTGPRYPSTRVLTSLETNYIKHIVMWRLKSTAEPHSVEHCCMMHHSNFSLWLSLHRLRSCLQAIFK